MKHIQAAMRRTISRPGHLLTGTSLRGRLALALTLALTTLWAAIGVPASVSLGASSDAVARYQLIIKEVLIHDDRDGGLAGQGEMGLTVQVIHCPDWLPSPCFYEGKQVGAQVTAKHSLKGNSGDTVTLNRVVPSAGDEAAGLDAPELGFYAIAGYHHVIRFDMTEYDDVSNNEGMGWVVHDVESSKVGPGGIVGGGAGIGTFTLRSLTNQGTKAGDYTVTFEVRQVDVPDVRTARVEVSDLPNSTKKHVCAVVQNIRDTPAGPFQVYILLNGSDSEGGKPVIPALGGGAVASACVDTAVPTVPEYDISVLLDYPRRLVEFNETNNTFTVKQKGTPKTAGPEVTPSSTPISTSTTAQADLTVTAVKVNGQEPNNKEEAKEDKEESKDTKDSKENKVGKNDSKNDRESSDSKNDKGSKENKDEKADKNDCKDAKYTVLVTVKNEGAASAETFVVRLAVGGRSGDDLEQTVKGLEAGKERELKFENVRLGEGEHTLKATADANDAVDESDEENNERDVTAGC